MMYLQLLWSAAAQWIYLFIGAALALLIYSVLLYKTGHAAGQHQANERWRRSVAAEKHRRELRPRPARELPAARRIRAVSGRSATLAASRPQPRFTPYPGTRIPLRPQAAPAPGVTADTRPMPTAWATGLTAEQAEEVITQIKAGTYPPRKDAAS